MIEVSLTYPTPDGSKEIIISGEKTTFGRGSEADHRFTDDGLSRLNSIIFRDGDRVWIVDDNSTNGTFVNGIRAAAAGTPLRSGDVIKIGNGTHLKVRVEEKKVYSSPKPISQLGSTGFSPTTPTSAPISAGGILPIALIAGAVVVISISALFIGYTVLGVGKPALTQVDETEPDDDTKPSKNTKSSPSPKNDNSAIAALPPDNSNNNNSIVVSNTPTAAPTPSGKKYTEMSDSEKRQYIETKAMQIAQAIGSNNSDPIPSQAVDKIKGFADAYASRIKVKPLSGCRFGDNLQATYERASKNAPFIIRAFNNKGVNSRIGLYLAMIESEHCVCLQSPTGPLGMFQFTFATAKIHFEPNDGIIKGASPPVGDDRCKPEPAARAAASYMKALTGKYGTGSASVPLAIGSYNSGEGGLSNNLQKALDSNTGLPRDFWTLIANGEKLSKQFQAENFKYVPKFFAAAIIGENPQDFGLTLQPLWTYTK